MVFRIIFFLLAIFAFSTVFAADVTYGFLKGIVKTDVGVVCANEKVVITAGEQKLNYTTDATGSFTCMVPSGDATILVMGSTKSVKIIEGEALEVQFVITKPGIMLTINNVTENNDTTYYNYEFSYQKNGMDGYIQSQRLGLGKYFFTLPEDATVFQAKVSLRVNNNYVFPLGYVHKVWTFDTKELRHDFTMDYIKPTKISLKLFNSDNTAVADGTKISGKLSRNLPLNNFTDWSKVNLSDNNLYPSIYENNDYIRFNTVVKDGMAALPECMPAISYSIQFSVEGGMDGAAMPMVVDENGKADIDSYKFQLRKLIQTVFDSAGKPVANANVNASYTLKGQIKVVSAKSDDKGIVTWVGLPNCRVITWGDNIPVGLIAPVISELTTPFTKPPYHFPNDFIIRTTSKTGAISGYYQYAIYDKTPPVYGNINTSGMTGYSSIQGNFNSLITMRVMTAEENPRYGELSFYVPYDDCPVPDPNGTEAIIEMTNFIPTTRHHIKILNADKTTPAQINSVKIYS
ncbi:MAG: carboxypeptidase-like regulatory domain-containing protein, partial [bacterium]